MNWAIIRTGGKQYKVAEGDVVSTEKVKPDKDGSVTFNDVLLVSSASGDIIGKPTVKTAKVTGKVLENFRDKKIRVVKFKSKSRYLRTRGHRQARTKFLIEKISFKG